MGETADEVRQLADLFSKMSGTVDDYRTQHFDALAPDERLRLEQLFQQLCDLHDQFTALAIEDTLQAMQSDLKNIVSVTREAQSSLQHLQKIADIANLVSATVELGADITTGDYGAIPSALQEIVKAIPKKATPKNSMPQAAGDKIS